MLSVLGCTFLAFLVCSDRAVAQISLQYVPNALTFQYQQDGSAPTPQTIAVTSAIGTPVSFTVMLAASGGNFFTVSPSSGATPATITVSVVPSALNALPKASPGEAVGGNLLFTPSTGVASPVQLTVNLTAAAGLSASPGSVALSNTQTSQAVTINGPTGAQITTTANYGSNNPSGWFTLSTTAFTAGQSVTVSLSSTTPPSGTTGSILFTQNGTSNSISVPVAYTLTLTGSGVSVSPAILNFCAATGGAAPPAQTLTLTSSGSPLTYTASGTVNNCAGFLSLDRSSGTTPAAIAVSVNPTGLAAGTCTGEVIVSPTGSGSPAFEVPVSLTIGGPTVSANPAKLHFAYLEGSSFSPLDQNWVVSGCDATGNPSDIPFTVSTVTNNLNWLSATPSTGTSPESVDASVNPAGLGTGTYAGLVTLDRPPGGSVQFSPLNIPVTLTVTGSAALTFSPSSLTFPYTAGATTAPSAQSVQVTSSGSPTTFSATTSSSQFTVTPTIGITPATLVVGVNPAALPGLTPGPYTGSVTVSAGSLGTATIPTDITVGAPGQPVVSNLVNAADFLPRPASPGEIISLFGLNLGPATPANLTLTSAGSVSTALGGTQVFFDTAAAPLTYVSSTQINAIVPYEVAGRATTSVTVNANGAVSTGLMLNVAATAPAIFSLTQIGSGQAAILNQNGTVNSISNPATKGSAIAIYATGEGALMPQPATGSVTASTGTTFPAPVGNVVLTVGGQPAEVLYGGEAPGLVSGVLQVNAIVPANVPSGPVSVVLSVGSNSSPSVVTVQVQ